MSAPNPDCPEYQALQARVVELKAGLARPIVVAVSGFGGSGKSTLAERLKQQLGDAEVVSIDAFIIDRLQKRSEDWEGFDRERFRMQVLEPVTRGEIALYEEYDWDTNAIVGWQSVPKSMYLIVEGISLFHPDLLKYYHFTIWIDCPPDAAAKRGAERDRSEGKDHDAYWFEVWKPNEQGFFDKYHPKDVASFVYHGHQ